MSNSLCGAEKSGETARFFILEIIDVGLPRGQSCLSAKYRLESGNRFSAITNYTIGYRVRSTNLQRQSLEVI